MTHPFKFMSALGVMVFLSFTTPAFAADRSFYVDNINGSASVQRVWYAAAGTTEGWQEVFLNYPIKPKTKSNFTMGDGDTCLYDIKIKFSDGYEETYSNVNMCRGDGVSAT